MKKPVCKQANMLEKDKLTSGQFSSCNGKTLPNKQPVNRETPECVTVRFPKKQ